MIMNARVLAQAYLEFTRRGDEPRPGSPWEAVQDTIDRDPKWAWQLLLWAVALSQDDADLAFIGTGPLESFLVRHESYLPHALRVARRHNTFREALRAADIRGANPVTVARLEAFFSDDV